MTDKPASRYMELNTPEQQAQAAKLLQWDWSDEVREPLTKYYRDTQNEPTSEAFQSELIDVIGYAPSVLLDVQRELGGISIDYGRNHWLDLGIQVNGNFFIEYRMFQFTLESNGVPAHFVNVHGSIHDDDKLFSNAKDFIEWYVTLRSTFFRL